MVEETGQEVKNQEKKPLIYRIGLIMIVTSLLLWIIPLLVPFLSMSVKLKATLISGAVIIAEILFWVGAVFVGKEVAGKIRGYLNPKNWRRKSKLSNQSRESQEESEKESEKEPQKDSRETRLMKGEAEDGEDHREN